jgi:hypothetical protein
MTLLASKHPKRAEEGGEIPASSPPKGLSISICSRCGWRERCPEEAVSLAVYLGDCFSFKEIGGGL